MTNMTNERAAEVLQEQIDVYGQEYDAEGIEALKKAIEVLLEKNAWQIEYRRSLKASSVNNLKKDLTKDSKVI